MFYFIYFILVFFISLSLTFFLKKIGLKYNFCDIAKGDALKIHKAPTPILGGLAMILAATIGFLFFLVQEKTFGIEIKGIIFAAIIIFCLGFWDDLKWKHISQIKPYQKFFLLIALPLLASLVLFISGIRIDFLFDAFYIIIPLTFLCIFIFINAVNYQDGMDGLAGGLSAISLIGFSLLAFASGNSLAFVVSICSLGAVLGFLVFNLPKAKIFMGDSGAYFLGFVLAFLVILFLEPYNNFHILGLIFIFGLPIFDGVFTNIRRILKGKSIFLGDRSHFYDRILQKGFSSWQTLAVCYSLQAVSVTIGYSLLTKI